MAILLEGGPVKLAEFYEVLDSFASLAQGLLSAKVFWGATCHVKRWSRRHIRRIRKHQVPLLLNLPNLMTSLIFLRSTGSQVLLDGVEIAQVDPPREGKRQDAPLQLPLQRQAPVAR